jgi:hypothetical protein
MGREKEAAMVRGRDKKRNWLVVLGVGTALALLGLGSCSTGTGTLDPGAQGRPSTSGSCSSPADGCPCDSPGATVECGEVVRRSNDFVTCSMGHRTCQGGRWGACEGDRIAFQSNGPQTMGGVRPLGSPPAAPCDDNPCNPNCNTFDQDAGWEGGGNFVPADGGGISLGPSDGGCVGLQCQVVGCDGGGGTTMSGTVRDPAGVNPIYNAVVYIPNAPLDPFPPGVQADQCGGGGTLTGQPISVAQTAADGTFTLQKVPTGTNIPIVVQIGRWRRKVIIPTVTACTNNALTTDQTRLPKNQSEGDIPLMAIATGGCDRLECLIKRIGVDPAEYTIDTGTGRVHIYQGLGGAPLAGGQNNMGKLFGSQAQLDKYDIVVLPCDCGTENTATSYYTVPFATAQSRLVAYADKGGRVFTSHWGRTWIDRGNPDPFPGVANWVADQTGSTIQGYVDTSFPKGVAFQTWLTTVGVTNPFTIDPKRIDVSSVIAPTERWVYNTAESAVINMAFATPVTVPQNQRVGRVVFSGTHVSAQDNGSPAQFPTICAVSNAMTAQEKALEFLFFDLSSCNNPVSLPPFNFPSSTYFDYQAVCPSQKKVVWRFFDWKAITPSDSKIDFVAQQSDTAGGLGAAMSVGLGTASQAFGTGGPGPTPPANWVGADVGLKFAPNPSLSFLRVTVTMYPSTDKYSAPTLSAWRQLYDCIDNQ